jgi:hypothetical protein
VPGQHHEAVIDAHYGFVEREQSRGCGQADPMPRGLKLRRQPGPVRCRQHRALWAYGALVDPIIAAALIAAASTGIVAIVGFWTSLRLAHSTAVRDRQAAVYQQILAFSAHQTESRRNITKTVRYDEKTEARLQGILDAYTPPDWFDLQASVLAFCPDSVVTAFTAAKAADDEVWSARYAHAEAVELNKADPGLADPNRAVALQKEFRSRIEEAEKVDSRLIQIARDRQSRL